MYAWLTSLEMVWLIPFHVYTRLIPSDTKTIGLANAPFEQKKLGWGAGHSDLNEAIRTADQDYIQRTVSNATISVRNYDQEGMHEVYARVVASKHLTCAVSTFCVFPAIGTRGESYFLHSPLLGGSPNLVDTLSAYFPQVQHMNEEYILSRVFWIWTMRTSDVVKIVQRDGETHAAV
jgi:hypothetical protein